MAKAKAPRLKENRMPFFRFLAWKSSDVTVAATFLIVNTYLTLFCSDFLGLDPAVIGTILLVSNIIDFITDFIGAIIVDNTNTKWGRGRPYELALVGLTACTIAMFATPAGWSNGLKYAWIFFMYTFAYGVFNTLRISAGVVYCVRGWHNNRIVIGKVSSFGGIVTTLGSMVVSTTFPTMMAKLATSPKGWLPLVCMYLVPLTLFGLLRFFVVKEDTSIDVEKSERVDLKAILNMIKKNKYAWYYGGMMLLFNTIQSMGTLSYYWKYIVGNTSMMGIVSIFGTLMLPLMFFFPIFLKKYSAAHVTAAGAIISSIGYLIVFFAGDRIPVLIGAALLTGFAALPISYLFNLFIMDLAQYNRKLGLPSMEASVTALFNGFGTQLGQGLGGFLTGILLSASGYIASTGDAVVVQPESALTMIRCLHSLVPMVLMIGTGIMAFKLSKMHKELTAEETEK